MGKLLQLPSQRQLVDRLLHLIEFNHPFIFLSGKSGSGRGTLCESLLGKLPERVRVVNLIGNAAMKMADVRQQLLQQVVAEPLFNPQEALANSFFRMLEGKPSHFLLLIERADELPVELVDELWVLCCHNDTLTSPHKLAILLTGSDVWCRGQKMPLKGRAMPALELVVAPLSAPEQRIFLYEKAKALKIPALLLPKARVEEILNAANGHPSAIMQLLEEIMTNRRPKKRQTELPIKKMVTVLAIVAAGLLALGYYLPPFNGESKPGSQTPSQELAQPNPVVNGEPLNAGASPQSDRSEGDDQVVREWQPDTKTLPKIVESETVTAGSANYEGRRVVISGEVVEKLMKQPNVSGAMPTAVVNGLAGKSSQATATQEAVANKSQAAVAAPVSAEPFIGQIPKVALTPATVLSGKAMTHYSIQLMGASNTQEIDTFVAENGLAGTIWVYKTNFRGSPWYVVLQGDHASIEQANAAIRQLSPALLKGQPWPKSFAQIQKELKQ